FRPPLRLLPFPTRRSSDLTSVSPRKLFTFLSRLVIHATPLSCPVDGSVVGGSFRCWTIGGRPQIRTTLTDSHQRGRASPRFSKCRSLPIQPNRDPHLEWGSFTTRDPMQC